MVYSTCTTHDNMQIQRLFLYLSIHCANTHEILSRVNKSAKKKEKNSIENQYKLRKNWNKGKQYQKVYTVERDKVRH